MKLPKPKRRSGPTSRQRVLRNEQSPQSRTAFSYNNQRASRETAGNTGRQSLRQIAQAEAAKHRFKLQIPRRSSTLILLAGGMIVVLMLISLSTSVTIKTVDDSNSRLLVREPSVYSASATAILKQSLLNRNKLTFDGPNLRKQLLKQYPELADVAITIPLIANKPLVYVEPVQPAMIVLASNGDFIVGTTGKVLVRSANAPKAARLSLPTLNDQSSVAPELNQQVLAADEVSFIRTLIAQLAAKQVTVASMVLPASSSELDVYVAGKPYFVKFNLQTGTVREQSGALLATQAQLAKQGITPAQYIDVRLDGRAYYQ